MGYFCRTLLWDTPVGHTLRTKLPPQVTLRGCKTSVSYETSSKSHASSLKNECFARDFLQKSHVKSPKRAFRMRLPPKVTCQVPKTSVSCETSSKIPMSKSAKRTFRTRFPPKVQRKHPSEPIHHATLPSSFAIPTPPNDTRSHANPNVTATFPTPAANLSASTLLMRTKYCAYYEMSPPSHIATSRFPMRATKENPTSTPQNPHKVLRLPRKVRMSSHMSFNKIYTTPHVSNDFDPLSTLPSTKIDTSAKTYHENKTSMSHPKT